MKRVLLFLCLIQMPALVFGQYLVSGDFGPVITGRDYSPGFNSYELNVPHFLQGRELEVRLQIDLEELLSYTRKRFYRMPVFAPPVLFNALPVIDYSEEIRHDTPMVKPGDLLGETATSFGRYSRNY